MDWTNHEEKRLEKLLQQGLEDKWLLNLKDYKYNTNLLKSGNTETFKI